MADDSPRPTPGNWPEQRNDAQPGWWSDLGRGDLPDDRGNPALGWIDLEALAPTPIPEVAPFSWRRILVFGLVAIAIIAALRAVIPQSVVGNGLFVLIPVGLVVIVTTVLADRPRR